MKLAIANHGKPRVENHAKGGYHAALSNATGKHFHFAVACIPAFLRAINWRSAALSRGSPEASNSISSSPRGKNSKLIIEGWCENSPQKQEAA